MVFQDSCAQSEVTILHLGGGPYFLKKNSKTLLCTSLEEEPGHDPIAALLFLDCSSFVSAFPHFSN